VSEMANKAYRRERGLQIVVVLSGVLHNVAGFLENADGREF